MIPYDLPETVTVDGKDYSIRTDYRAALDIIAALNDPDLTEGDRIAVLLGIFYAEEPPENIAEAISQCFWFLAAGKPNREGQNPRLVDWEKDFPWIVSPINRMLGRDVRGEKMHWWTFLSLYYEIGESTFSKIVSIRSARARGKPLDKADREWMRMNADLVNIDTRYSSAENETLTAWMGGGDKHAE